MISQYAKNRTGAGSQPIGRISLAAATAGFLSRLLQGARGRSAVEHVARLDDRMLDDIGLARCDVDDALKAPLTDDPTKILAARRRARQLQRRAI
ncbi:MAG: DUF1127 domain-containing protein [Pseudomonadota bacterium]